MEDVRNSDSAVTCLVMMARFHGLAVQPEQIRHQFGDASQSIEAIDLLRAAKFLKLRTKRAEVSCEKLQDLPLPAIARHTDGHYFIIAKCHEGKALIQDPKDDKPETVTLEVLETLFTGELFLSTVRNADRIIVMEKGRIVEEGHHDKLVTQGGHYARLNAHQHGLREAV